MSDVLSSLLPPQEKLRLKWGNHKENISSVFQEFRNSGDFCDVTLVCGGHQLEAHRVILAASSAFFRDMLQRHPHPHPLVYMKGVDCKHLWSVVNFMYRGEVNISEADLASFMEVAEDLQVKGLTKDTSSSTTPSFQPEEEPGLDDQVQEGVWGSQGVKEEKPEMEVITGNQWNEVERGAVENDDMNQNYKETCESSAVGSNPFNQKLMEALSEREGAGITRDYFKNYILSKYLGRGPATRHECKICGKVFMGSGRHNVVNHVENVHFPGAFQHKCPNCEKSFKSKVALAGHKHSVHRKKSE